jgi:hypothetical protein
MMNLDQLVGQFQNLASDEIELGEVSGSRFGNFFFHLLSRRVGLRPVGSSDNGVSEELQSVIGIVS